MREGGSSKQEGVSRVNITVKSQSVTSRPNLLNKFNLVSKTPFRFFLLAPKLKILLVDARSSVARRSLSVDA